MFCVCVSAVGRCSGVGVCDWRATRPGRRATPNALPASRRSPPPAARYRQPAPSDRAGQAHHHAPVHPTPGPATCSPCSSTATCGEVPSLPIPPRPAPRESNRRRCRDAATAPVTARFTSIWLVLATAGSWPWDCAGSSSAGPRAVYCSRRRANSSAISSTVGTAIFAATMSAIFCKSSSLNDGTWIASTSFINAG
jgi:hypothetical protein